MMMVNINNIPKNTNIIDTRWVLVIKNDNTKKKLDQQLKVVNRKKVKILFQYNLPTAQSDNLRITIAIASINKWNSKQLDIKAAYLNAELISTKQYM